jgi:hypothetical protein
MFTMKRLRRWARLVRSAAAVASTPQGILAGLMRRNGESWGNLLLRLNEAIMQSIVKNRVIRDLLL